MKFEFCCPNCGQKIAATTEKIGARGGCPMCQKALKIPAPDRFAGDQKRSHPQAESSSTMRNASSGAASATASADDWKSVASWMQLLGGLLILALVIGGIALLFTGVGLPFGFAAFFAARLVFLGIAKMNKAA